MDLNNSLKKYLHELRMEKKQKRRLTSFITAMSVFVSTGVFWQLRGKYILDVLTVQLHQPGFDNLGREILTADPGVGSLTAQGFHHELHDPFQGFTVMLSAQTVKLDVLLDNLPVAFKIAS